MVAQDDARENQMRALFNLEVPEDRGRADIDAFLEMDGVDELLPFELKSTTGKDISTVRDLGPDHIAKWRDLHWLFAFYDSRGDKLQYCKYASPGHMRPWVDRLERYIRPDLVLAERAPALITDAVLSEVLGDQETFDIAAAKSVMKKQWSATEYRANADLPGGLYSRAGMLDLLRRRCEYVIRRGATLNNPHIPSKHFNGLPLIVKNHASVLRQLVQDYLDQVAAAAKQGSAPPQGTTDPVVQHAATQAEELPGG